MVVREARFVEAYENSQPTGPHRPLLLKLKLGDLKPDLPLTALRFSVGLSDETLRSVGPCYNVYSAALRAFNAGRHVPRRF
jgi:hypothetical protein